MGNNSLRLSAAPPSAVKVESIFPIPQFLPVIPARGGGGAQKGAALSVSRAPQRVAFGIPMW